MKVNDLFTLLEFLVGIELLSEIDVVGIDWYYKLAGYSGSVEYVLVY